MLEGLEDERKGVNLVDFSQIIISTVLAAMDQGEKLSVDTIRHLTLNSIRSGVMKQRNEYPETVICFDNGEGGYWRKKLAFYYKGQRKKQQAKSKWDWDTIYEAINTVRDELRENMPYKTIWLRGVEADDIIAVLTKHLHKDHNILITSGDGDFTQLQKFGKSVRQWSPIQEKWIKPKFGSPRNDLLTKIVKGDAKDGIANIKSPSDWVINKPEGKRAPSITKKILEQVYDADNPQELFDGDELERFQENEKLLDFELIPDDIQNDIIEQYNTVEVAPKRKIYPYFVKKRLTNLMEKVSEF